MRERTASHLRISAKGGILPDLPRSSPLKMSGAFGPSAMAALSSASAVSQSTCGSERFPSVESNARAVDESTRWRRLLVRSPVGWDVARNTVGRDTDSDGWNTPSPQLAAPPRFEGPLSTYLAVWGTRPCSKERRRVVR